MERQLDVVDKRMIQGIRGCSVIGWSWVWMVEGIVIRVKGAESGSGSGNRVGWSQWADKCWRDSDVESCLRGTRNEAGRDGQGVSSFCIFKNKLCWFWFGEGETIILRVWFLWVNWHSIKNCKSYWFTAKSSKPRNISFHIKFLPFHYFCQHYNFPSLQPFFLNNNFYASIRFRGILLVAKCIVHSKLVTFVKVLEKNILNDWKRHFTECDAKKTLV